jgi:geranylgeranyl reductase family protein
LLTRVKLRRTVIAVWDVAIVGAGPAGCAAALGALTASPSAKVLLLDRSEFPRDKSCGDGIAPHVLDVLDSVGVGGPLNDKVPVRRLALQQGGFCVERSMARPAYVVPRRLFDSRLHEAAVRAGAQPQRIQVRTLQVESDGVTLNDGASARVVIGADGASSAVRAALGIPAVRRRALALRGYAPTQPAWRGRQVITVGRGPQPTYAWAFDRGDGLSNVGYGELLTSRRPHPTRESLLKHLEMLLPGAAATGSDWLGHHLPLSSWRWRHPDGPVLLAGDAAGLVNPLTGEGIYYAVATGVAAGRAAVTALGAGNAVSAGAAYRNDVHRLLQRHLRSTAAGSRVASVPPLMRAALRAAQADQQVFDEFVEVGLGRGRLSARAVRSVSARVVRG